ncbi:MAG TPA: non-homologous end-joining DNA ligase [Solirubrobacteraceae bacterium]|nr:non-homologous end-joining DNA ligase [Solirubrobacteraceae bacterium]
MNDVLAVLSASERALVSRSAAPEWVEPMKATLAAEPFTDPAWIFERKLDGIRSISRRTRSQVSLLSRNDLSLNARFPELVPALEGIASADFVADGEIVAFEGHRTSFARLARRHQERVPVFLYLFDLLYLDDYDLRRLPLMARKRLLRHAFDFGGRIRLTSYRRRDGEPLFGEACRRGWEGLVAKRIDSPYTGRRSRDWLKLKCTNEQELVIGGYTAPRGSRIELGALLVGYFQGDRLIYAGRVGTGFDRATLRDLAGRLAPLRRDSSPFADPDVPARDTTWVEPRLVAQVAFAEWTRAGRLRHPRFVGLREDKDAREVVRELPT